MKLSIPTQFAESSITDQEINSLNEVIARTTVEYKQKRHTELQRKLKKTHVSTAKYITTRTIIGIIG